MTRLATLLLALLRRLLSSAFVTRSIKRLWMLIHAILRRFSKERPLHRKDTRQTCIPPPSHTHDLPISDVICPSLQPPSREIDNTSLHVPSHDFEQHIPYPVHSPTPQRGFLLPYAYDNPQSSRSSHDILTEEQDLGALSPEDYNHDAISISTRRSANHPSSSNVSLPVSFHGLLSNSSRPDSRNSQRPSLLRPASHTSQRTNSRTSKPLKVSRPPTPASANMALPAGALPPDMARQGSPPPLRTMEPMSTASVQRYNRNITVYVLTRVRLHRWLIYSTQTL
jgi:hypothetical protein